MAMEWHELFLIFVFEVQFLAVKTVTKSSNGQNIHFESKYQEKLVSFHCHICFQNTVQKLYQSDKNWLSYQENRDHTIFVMPQTPK